ncbi:Calcium-binding protein M [Intoshia linei]|uniref:Calcium-binding protein M n=1 Tax=Intoshia linei TaxID=1819745 RepID=A0A177B1B4_9BILA|nr:Calcium-binding protein M [Intoshia linei]
MGQSKSKQKLSKDDIRLLQNQTTFTKFQIKEWYKGFMRDCPDGNLSREKFINVYSSFFPEGNAQHFCDHVFRTFDVDNSGHIDFKEFLMAINITSSDDPRKKLEWAFLMYDIDGNGEISREEMSEIINSIYNMIGSKKITQTAEERTAEIFEKMDSNNDNVLTKYEFIEGCLNDPCLYAMLTSDDINEDDDD